MAVVELVREVDGLEEIAGLSGRALDEVLVALERERRAVEARIAAVIGRADETGHFCADGHATVAAWAQATCNWSPGEARLRTRVARLGRALPSVLPALDTGEIGVAQVQELARLHANPRARRQLAGSEALLVDQAGVLWCADFQLLCRRWEQLADEDGAHRSHAAAVEGRTVHCSIVGGCFRLEAEGDVISGTAMGEILSRFTDTEFVADWDQARQRCGDAVTPALLERTASQRRFDALKAIFFAAAGATTRTPGAPLVNLMVDLQSFEHHLARFFGQPTASLDPATVVDRRCETSAGHLVDPHQVVAAALTGQVRRVVVDSAGRVVDLGRRRRLFTGAVREAVRLGDRRCTWPGCPIPAARTQIDHTIPWATGHGLTNIDNGAPLCGRHNLHKTRGYRTWRDPTGHWHHYRPDGTEITPRAQPP